MSKRLPEGEAEFRLVDPIAEEYRQLAAAYDQMLFNVIADDWLDKGKPDIPLADFAARRIEETLVSCMEHGCFGGANGGVAVSLEVLDSICRKWGLGDTFDAMCENYERRMNEEYDPELPDVFRKALE